MTHFHRVGHWRTNRYGKRYWVGDHGVSRDDWDRESGYSNATSIYLLNRLREIHADRGITATFVSKNAECPVCGARVYFYQNSFGSRVYFDDLGIPWPKHPCTDIPKYRGRVNAQGGQRCVEPAPRAPEEVRNIQEWLESTDLEPALQFWNQHGLSQWHAYRLARKVKTKSNTLLILTPISDPDGRNVLLRGAKVPRALKEGVIAFYYRGWVSCFDLDAMKPINIEVARLGSSKDFVAALVSDK